MTITLKNVPRGLHQALKKQAKLHKRSLNKEAITCLEGTLGLIPPDRQALFDEIVKFREKLAAKGVVAMTQDELRAAIDEGRE